MFILDIIIKCYTVISGKRFETESRRGVNQLTSFGAIHHHQMGLVGQVIGFQTSSVVIN